MITARFSGTIGPVLGAAASRGERRAGSESSWPPCDEKMTPVLLSAPLAGDHESVRPPFPEILARSMILKPGRQLGPYRLLERLGQGGQGDVWKTRRDGPLGELVALKVLKPELAHNPTRMAQFRREAQRGLRLKGRSLLAAHELSEIDGFHCIAMPFVLGTSLRDVIKWRISYLSGEETERHHPLVGMALKDYYRVIAGALAKASLALAEAHDKQIAHRDIKPANILLDNRSNGRVYLCDFGLGRDLDVATCEQMRDGAGTPMYMAPERLLLFAADEIKCDIYSMGVTLFEALLLEKPFHVPAHVTAPCLAPHLATAEPKRPRQLDPDFPVELEAVITKAMAREPARRFESARDLAFSLSQFVMRNPAGRTCGPAARMSSSPPRGQRTVVTREPALRAEHSELDRSPPWQ
jgi:serine/threonine-protein kinase